MLHVSGDSGAVSLYRVMFSSLRNWSSTFQTWSATGEAERYSIRTDRTDEPFAAKGIIAPSSALRVETKATPSRSSTEAWPNLFQEEISGSVMGCAGCSPGICCVTSPKVCCTKQLPLLRCSGEEPK